VAFLSSQSQNPLAEACATFLTGQDSITKAWFERGKKRIDQPTPPDARRVKTDGLWTKCENCRAIVWKKGLDADWRICLKCWRHFRLRATQRLELLFDSPMVGHDAALASIDHLKFTDTRPSAPRLKEARQIGRHNHSGRSTRREANHMLFDGVRVHRQSDTCHVPLRIASAVVLPRIGWLLVLPLRPVSYLIAIMCRRSSLRA